MNPGNRSLHQIFVYDKDLFPILDDIQPNRDDLLVRGEISYRLEKDEFGKTTSSAYITAKQLYRI